MIYDTKTEEVLEVLFEEQPDCFGYTEWATDIDPEEPKSYCKKEVFSKHSKYYVKVAPNGVLFDPWGSDANVRMPEYGRNKYEYKLVKENIFNEYFMFLKNKNAAHLLRAQRLFNEVQ